MTDSIARPGGQAWQRANTDWFRDARWGVFIHYLASPASAIEPAAVSIDDWNRRIDAFDAETLAAQLADVGAGYAFITLGQNSGFFLSPNAAYDEIVGRRPSRLSRRDLVADMATALGRFGIRLMAYVGSHAPALDVQAVEALKCTPPWDAGGWGLHPGAYRTADAADPRLAAFQRNWESVIREWSLRWGRNVWGWWFDGCYYADRMYNFPDEPNFRSLASAAKAGNPDSLVAFNGGARLPLVSLTPFEDFTAGEVDNAFPVTMRKPNSRFKPLERFVAGAQYHALSFLGEWWGQGEPRFDPAFVVGYTRHTNAHGGVVSWDVPLTVRGPLPDAFVRQLKQLQAAAHPRKRGAEPAGCAPAQPCALTARCAIEESVCLAPAPGGSRTARVYCRGRNAMRISGYNRRIASGVMAAAVAAALATGGAKSMADTPTLDEMDKYVAKMSAQDLDILKNLKPHEIWVAPDGKAGNTGTKDSPIDLKTAYTNPKLVTPGTLVWIPAGTYTLGNLKPDGICGTREKPIIFRAVPGARATLNAAIWTKRGCDHIWWWGVEVTGPDDSGVEVRDGGNDLKFINLFIHDKHSVEPPATRKPSAMGVGGWNCGDDHEFYGDIVFRNGWNGLDHGFYTQNTAAHTAKRYVDNLVFENTGLGFQIYGSDPVLQNIYFEGNTSFCTGLNIPYHPQLDKEPQMNVLIGGGNGAHPLSCVVVRNNCTYHPALNAKRGVDIGYKNKPNTQILVEGNYFTGGLNAMELNHASDQVVVRNNTFWSPNGMVSAVIDPPGNVVFEHNSYIDNGKFDLAKLKAATKSGETDKVVPGKNGRPADLFVFKRVNRYEPGRVNLVVYNWPKTDTVALDLADVLKQGQKFRIVEVHDLWAKPAVEGAFDGKPVQLKMAGDYAPEFGCYILFRE